MNVKRSSSINDKLLSSRYYFNGFPSIESTSHKVFYPVFVCAENYHSFTWNSIVLPYHKTRGYYYSDTTPLENWINFENLINRVLCIYLDDFFYHFIHRMNDHWILIFRMDTITFEDFITVESNELRYHRIHL